MKEQIYILVRDAFGKGILALCPFTQEGEVMFRSTSASPVSLPIPSCWRQRNTGRSPVGHSCLFFTAEMEAGASDKSMNL